MGIKEKLLSRKFILSVMIIIVASAALFAGVLSGSEFVAAASFIMGLYGATNSANAFATAKAMPKERNVQLDVKPRQTVERANKPEE